MSYIGNSPALKYASFAVQHFTTSATTGYTLDNAVTNENDIRLVINNVVQQPGGSYAYTASGTTLTLSAATTGSDTMYCVFIGKAVQTVNPPVGSVDSAQLATDAVTTVKITDSNITNAKMADDAIGVAELSATGTASSSTFLRGDNSWTDPGGVALTGSTDNTVVTVTGANAIAGEATFTYNGATAEITGSAPVMKINSTADSSLQFLAGTSSTCGIQFGDSGDSGIGSINYINTDDSLRVSVNGGEQVRIFSNGVIAAADGIALGAGIANTAANVLDDYEEGTWTPTFDHGGDATGVTYAQQMGYYTKIGRVVSYNFGLVLTAKGSGTGHTRVDGLPFSSVNAGYDEPPAVLKFSNISNAYSMIGLTASTRMSFWGTDTDDSGTGPLYKANFDDNFECYGAGVYITAA
tara:strand:- start:561 stop:1790 length:1230 start_codon:yes stop_codon:yes gene_type:complete